MIATLAVADTIICFYLVSIIDSQMSNHCFLQVQLRVLQLFDWYFIPNQYCFLVSLHGIFCLSVQSFMGLSLGIDRLMAVIAPIR